MLSRFFPGLLLLLLFCTEPEENLSLTLYQKKGNTSHCEVIHCTYQGTIMYFHVFFSKIYCSSEAFALLLTVPSQFPTNSPKLSSIWCTAAALFHTNSASHPCFHMNNLHGSSLCTGEARDYAAAHTAWGRATRKEFYPLFLVSESPFCSPQPATRGQPHPSCRPFHISRRAVLGSYMIRKALNLSAESCCPSVCPKGRVPVAQRLLSCDKLQTQVY